jgi:hypothetical protein
MENITLDNLVFTPCYYGFKFGKLDRLNDLRGGHIYMKNLEYFIQEELNTGIKGRGDKDEAVMFNSTNVKAFDPDSDLLIFTAKAQVRHLNDNYKPAFCMMLKDLFQHPVRLDYPNLITELRFDEKLLEDFSDDGRKPFIMIITDVGEFFNRIQIALIPKNLRILRGFVKYRDTNVVWKTESGIEFNDAFCKNGNFKYQEEYRLLLETKVEDHYELNIGSIKDITEIVEAKNIIKNGIKVNIKIQELIESQE